MKKISAILLICIYALSASGIGVKQFYCCGKLKSTSFSFGKEDKESCKLGNKKSGCCKTEFHGLQAKDDHSAPAEFTAPVKYFSEAIIHGIYTEAPRQYSICMVNNFGHAPPESRHRSLYKLHCVYRI